MSNDIPFAARVAILDQYIHSNNPEIDMEIVDLIIETVKKDADIRRYFFSNRPNPSWIPLLWEADFFAKQPEFEVNTNGTFLGFWEAHEFLLSVATDAPEYIIRHLDNLETCNDWYKAGAVQGLTKIDPVLAATAIPRIIGWLEKADSNWSLSNNASELLIFMANNNFRNEAFGLFSALTSPILKLGNEKTTSYHQNEASLLDHSPIRHYKPDNIYLNSLEKLDATRLIKTLETNLRMAIDKESSITERDSSKISYWRTAIEDTEQDLGESAKDSLLQALRDTLDHIIPHSNDIALSFINGYLTDEYEILRRLALYFLHSYPKIFDTLIIKELMNFSNLDETGIHHEFFLLLQKGFPVLAENEKKSLINAILQGPPRDELESFVKSVAQNENRTPDEFRKTYIDYWVKNRLWMIRENLTKEAKETLDDLIATSGVPDHPDFTSWMSSGDWVADKSPIEESELLSMEPEDLLKYLQAWKPDTERSFSLDRITWGGLAGSVANILVANPEKYISHLTQIALYRPILTQSIFGHLANENYPILGRHWHIWLDLAAHILETNNLFNEESIQEEDNPDLTQTVRSIVQLIKRGLQHKDSTLPSELLQKIRDILLILIYHPDPNIQQDHPGENWFGHLDPITVSINRVRPMALEALAIYAIEKAKLANQDSKKVKWEAQVRNAFTHKLDKNEDPSWAVHSIFGKYFPTFYWLDKKWAKENVDKIFPEENNEEAIWFFVSAWESLLLNGYRSYLMPILRKKYFREIEYLSKGYKTESHLNLTSRFAIHIIIDYCLSEYALDSHEGQNSLLVNIETKADPDTRSDIANACWLVYKDNPKDSEKFWPRIKAVWEWRTKQASINNHPSDFDKEIKMFGNIPLVAPPEENIVTLWPLLEGLLPHTTRGEGFRYDWMPIEKFLLKQVDKYPGRVMQYYKMLYDQLVERPKWLYHSDESKELINKGIYSGNLEAKQITLNLLDNFIRWGDNTFKELYYTNAK